MTSDIFSWKTHIDNDCTLGFVRISKPRDNILYIQRIISTGPWALSADVLLGHKHQPMQGWAWDRVAGQRATPQQYVLWPMTSRMVAEQLREEMEELGRNN